MAKYLNFDSMVNEICNNISSMIPNVGSELFYVERLSEAAYIKIIQDIIYINGGLNIDTAYCDPKTIINMSKYIDLSLVLKRNSILNYYCDNIKGCEVNAKISLKLTHFDENKLPVFKINNMQDIVDLMGDLENNSIDSISIILDAIKSDDNKYLYKLLTSDYGSEDVDDKETQHPTEPDIPENITSTSIEVQTIKPKLSDNSWEEVIYASENNCIPDTWKIGDEIDLVLNGYFDETVTLQIWDFKHYDKSDGSGKAGILFGMKHLMKVEQQMNTIHTNIGGWNDSYMRNTVMKNIYESIPEYIRNNIKEVNTYANAGTYYHYTGQGLVSTDKVFIPGLSEIDNEWELQNKTETEQSIISIFKDKKNRIKRMNNGNGLRGEMWTRSPYYDSSDMFCILYYDSIPYNTVANYNGGVCFCFNI